jgi:regulator of sigma E protease
MYYAYEAIVGKPLNPKVQEAGFRVGIAILGTLMVFVFVNDILKLF